MSRMNLLQVFLKLPTNARRLFSEILLKGSQKWKRNHFLIGLIAKIFSQDAAEAKRATEMASSLLFVQQKSSIQILKLLL